MSLRPALLICLCLAACAEFPELGPEPAAGEPQPQILPLDALLAEAVASGPVEGSGDLSARAAALRARAAALRARAAALRGGA
jgi:hypothetical protein